MTDERAELRAKWQILKGIYQQYPVRMTLRVLWLFPSLVWLFFEGLTEGYREERKRLKSK